jgi:hypothetical protein
MAVLCAYYAIDAGVFQGKASGDGWFGFNYLRAIFEFGTLDMQKVLPSFLPFFGTGGPGHHMPNRCPIGPVFIWAPFYVVALGLQWIGQLAHVVPRGDASSPFVAWITGVGTLGGVLVGWRYTYVLVARYTSVTAARLGTIVAVFATPLAWYTATQPFYQHGLAFCFVAILVENWDRTRGNDDWRRFLWLGVIGGLGATMREQEALYLLLPGCEAAWHVLRGPNRARWLVGGIVLTLAFIVAFSPQLLVWRYYTGSALTPAQVEPLRWSTPFIIVSLFSTRGGLFPWSPIAYAAVIGIAVAWRRAPVIVLSLLGAFVVELYVVSSAWVLTGGYGYGARRLSDCAVLIALAVALLWTKLDGKRWPRRILAGFGALCIALNVWAMELLRAHRIASSGAYARTAEYFFGEIKAPPALGRFFGAVGYPFVQPAGWIFALAHHTRASAFEGIVGNFILDRDGQWMQLQNRSLPIDASTRPYVSDGLDLAQKPARVTGPVRILVPLFARETVGVHVRGDLAPGARRASWNGTTIPTVDEPGGLRFEVPAPSVNAGVNELQLGLPPGSSMTKLDFDSLTKWWDKSR